LPDTVQTLDREQRRAQLAARRRGSIKRFGS